MWLLGTLGVIQASLPAVSRWSEKSLPGVAGKPSSARAVITSLGDTEGSKDPQYVDGQSFNRTMITKYF